MSRPVILPAFVVAIAVVGLAGAFTAHRSDARAQKLRDRAALDDSIRRQVAARHDSELAERRNASAPACPSEPQDVSAWGAGTQESFPVVVPLVPDGDLAVLVERAVDMLIDNTMRQRFAQTRAVKKQKPRRSTRRTRSRYIPRAVVRAVHQRDAGRCTFVSPDGRRC